jgi:hypothetical protein
MTKAAVELALTRAAQIAERVGIACAPLRDSTQLLWQKLDGDVLKIRETIAYYDEYDDEIVFNPAHPAWEYMREFVRSLAKRRFYSTWSPDHVIRHEIGHCLHYRQLTDPERARIWYSELTDEETRAAIKVSGFATLGRAEFVAEVFARMWARGTCEPSVLTVYESLRGPIR